MTEQPISERRPIGAPPRLAASPGDGTMHSMTTNERLSDEELRALAGDWRRRALQGDLHARGVAHELETEMRRRVGAPFPNYDTLDMRPLELRTAVQRRWWRFWRPI